jgi:hypothetical protein
MSAFASGWRLLVDLNFSDDAGRERWSKEFTRA